MYCGYSIFHIYINKFGYSTFGKIWVRATLVHIIEPFMMILFLETFP